MSTTSTVQAVEIKKRGVNQKTGKPWTMFEVTCANGIQATGFDQVKVGDPVELEPKGDFLNYFKIKLIPGVPVEGSAQEPEGPPARFNGPKLDERQRAIIRQHSQSMALEVLKLKQALGQLAIEDLTPAKLHSLADYFDKDVMGAAQSVERDEPY